MDLDKYDEKFILPPAGFNNIGFTCYYNSLIQSLLSCTSFVKELYRTKKDNEVIDALNNIILKLFYISNNKDDQVAYEISQLAPHSWRQMIKKLSAKSYEFAHMAVGQQCAAEGFSLLLQTFEECQNIQNLFIHKRENSFYCGDCDSIFSKVTEINNLFEVEPELIAAENKEVDLGSFLLFQKNTVDKDCVCSKCGVKNEKIKNSKLTMVPEILFVMSKKYKYENGIGEKLHIHTNFPETLTFKGRSQTLLIYKACAMIQHSGQLNGGHYWAICKRLGGWYCLNDNSVSTAEFKPDINTYIVLYHII